MSPQKEVNELTDSSAHIKELLRDLAHNASNSSIATQKLILDGKIRIAPPRLTDKWIFNDGGVSFSQGTLYIDPIRCTAKAAIEAARRAFPESFVFTFKLFGIDICRRPEWL